MNINEMKKNRLYKITVKDFYISEKGEKVEFIDYVIGYIREDKNNFFYGCVFSYDYGEINGGDTMSLTKDQQKNIIDIKEI